MAEEKKEQLNPRDVKDRLARPIAKLEFLTDMMGTGVNYSLTDEGKDGLEVLLSEILAQLRDIHDADIVVGATR